MLKAPQKSSITGAQGQREGPCVTQVRPGRLQFILSHVMLKKDKPKPQEKLGRVICIFPKE